MTLFRCLLDVSEPFTPPLLISSDKVRSKQGCIHIHTQIHTEIANRQTHTHTHVPCGSLKLKSRDYYLSSVIIFIHHN